MVKNDSIPRSHGIFISFPPIFYLWNDQMKRHTAGNNRSHFQGSDYHVVAEFTILLNTHKQVWELCFLTCVLWRIGKKGMINKLLKLLAIIIYFIIIYIIWYIKITWVHIINPRVPTKGPWHRRSSVTTLQATVGTAVFTVCFRW